jgi:hypothetical protein
VARRSPRRLLLVLGTLLVLLALPLQHLHRTTQEDRVRAHATALLDEPAVRDALEREALSSATRQIARASGLPAEQVRQAIAPLTTRVLRSSAFERAWRGAAVRAVRRTLDADDRTIRFTVGDVVAAIEEDGGRLPPVLEPYRADADRLTVVTYERSASAARWSGRAADVAALGWPMLLAGLGLLGLAVVLAPGARSLALAGLGALVAGGVVLVAERLGRAAVEGAAEGTGDQEVARVVWDELVGGLRPVAAAVAGAGLAVLVLSRLGRRRPVSAGRSSARR